MNQEQIESYSEALYECLRGRTTMPPITDTESEVSVEDAYQISRLLLQRRLDDGEKVVGKKIGITSKAVQDMLGVHEPDFGYLTDKMEYSGEIPISSNLVAPKAEGEIAFLLKKDLVGPGVTNEAVLEATDLVMPCFEVVDSRISDWKIKIQDTVADNASCGLFAVNREAAIDPRTVDLTSCRMEVFKNGAPLSSGTGAEAMGSPVNCVAWLANTLGRFGIALHAGEIILSGSLVPLENVAPGDMMTVVIENMGECEVRFT